MPVKIPADNFKTATARLDRKVFPHQKRPHWCHLDHGIAVGYRTSEPYGFENGIARGPRGAGKWVKRFHGKESPLGTADDREEANGVEVLTYAQAVAKALGRTDLVAANRCSLGHALKEVYSRDLKLRGKDPTNALTIFNHIHRVAPSMLPRDVNTVSKEEWTKLKTDLLDDGMSPVSWNRQTKNLCAALNLVAPDSKKHWSKALKKVSDNRREEDKADNVVLSETDVLRWVAAAYADNHNFGLLVDVLATTGARPSQAVRLRVRHLIAASNRLEMPKSGKGGGEDPAARKRDTYKCYIPASLTARLVAAAKGRKPGDFLLVRDNGADWGGKTNRPFMKYREQVERTLKAIDLTHHEDGQEVSLYALRHTNITRQLMGQRDPRAKEGEIKYLVFPLPALVVAKAHDTSVVMIEKHYAAKIADHTEEMIRATLLDHGTVVTLKDAA
jgi:integrase